MAETTITGALCGVIAAALVEKGVDPALAMALAKRACVPAIEKGGPLLISQQKKIAKRRVGKAKSASKNLSKAFKMANEKLRNKNGQLRKGKTQADVARMAQRLRKKMDTTTKGDVRKTARRAFER